MTGQQTQLPAKRPVRLVAHSVTTGKLIRSVREGSQPLHQELLPPHLAENGQNSRGALLQNDRYRLRGMLERREWNAGVCEMVWAAQDLQRGGAPVIMCEVVILEGGSITIQSMLRTATIGLTSIGRHPNVPTLWNVFSEQGRHFFVFEPIEGESILDRMRLSGRALPEADVIECCLQIIEVLELLTQQSPMIVHGSIRPEHICIAPGGQYLLTNFSTVLAGGAIQLLMRGGERPAYSSPYIAPEFTQGMVDVRSDIYALLATAYHAVTGSMPTRLQNGELPSAQQLNPLVSTALTQILAKGLHTNVNARYHSVRELRQDLESVLLALKVEQQRSENLRREALAAIAPPKKSISQILPTMLAPSVEAEIERAGEQQSSVFGKSVLQSSFWIVIVLLCLFILFLIVRILWP